MSKPSLLCLKSVASLIMVWTLCSVAQPATAQGPVAAAVPSQVIDVFGVVEVVPVEPAEPVMTLGHFLEVEHKIQAVIPSVQACVVSVEGGSGFIVNEDGLIITASHVTKKTGRRVAVRFPDGKTHPAVTLGSNPSNDTGAVQLLEKGPWPHLEIAESLFPDKGQWCLAFGYPISFPRGALATVRLGRVTQVSERKIVTDCPIMGGDSGGPLVDLDGKVIGINTGVTTNVQENFHVPYEAFEEDKERILAGNEVVTADSQSRDTYFGVLGETDRDRVRIRKVYKGSPADIAGLRQDDVITQLDGVPLDSFSKFLDLLDARNPGERVIAQVNRYGQLLDFYIWLGHR